MIHYLIDGVIAPPGGRRGNHVSFQADRAGLYSVSNKTVSHNCANNNFIGCKQITALQPLSDVGYLENQIEPFYLSFLLPAQIIKTTHVLPLLPLCSVWGTSSAAMPLQGPVGSVCPHPPSASSCGRMDRGGAVEEGMDQGCSTPMLPENWTERQAH